MNAKDRTLTLQAMRLALEELEFDALHAIVRDTGQPRAVQGAIKLLHKALRVMNAIDADEGAKARVLRAETKDRIKIPATYLASAAKSRNRGL